MASLMGDETVKVLAAVKMQAPIQLDAAVQAAFVKMSENVTRLTDMAERAQQPLKILSYCAGFSLLLFSMSALMNSFGSLLGRSPGVGDK
jgi:hypothetical protein